VASEAEEAKGGGDKMKYEDLPEIELSQEEFDRLPEYSMSVPTANRPSDITERNRRWKRDIGGGQWAIGEYSVDEQPDGRWLVTRWYRVSVEAK
jgi:hypothetical protein